MPFFSKRFVIGAGETHKVLDFPAGVRLVCLSIKAEGGDILLSPSAMPENTGMTFTDGSGITFSADDIKTITREEKALYAFSTAGADVEIFGILEY